MIYAGKPSAMIRVSKLLPRTEREAYVRELRRRGYMGPTETDEWEARRLMREELDRNYGYSAEPAGFSDDPTVKRLQANLDDQLRKSASHRRLSPFWYGIAWLAALLLAWTLGSWLGWL